jgi:hypothetical protein
VKERITLEWDAHTRKALYESDRWAASDRGWLYATIQPSSMSIQVTGTTYVTLGHYLDYERDGKPYVHAVSCVTRESIVVDTPEQARSWIEAQAAGRIARFFGDCHQGYEHRKVAIRGLPVDLLNVTFRDEERRAS